MERNELIKTLIACSKTRFEDGDREWLETLTEAQLEKLRAVEDPGKEPSATSPTANADDAAAAAPAANTDDPPSAPEKPSENPVTLEEYIKAAPDEIGQILNEAIEERKAFKVELIDRILKNESCTFTKEQLGEFGITELKNIANLANVELPEHDYSGQGGGLDANAEEGKIPAMEPVFEPAKK